ncbi:MAG: hypothetical protein MJ177_09130 [Clostridia bacterium]|nr:hypothetical protein [Clostridia bacterium]
MSLEKFNEIFMLFVKIILGLIETATRKEFAAEVEEYGHVADELVGMIENDIANN